MRLRALAGVGSLFAVGAVFTAGERDAYACGGCFHPPTEVASDITDERMLLSVSTQQTTLYDQIRYSGAPSSFAWVLPIHGTVDIGLSADVLFNAMDAVTATKIQAPPTNCPAPPQCPGAGLDAPTSAGASSGSSGSAPPGVVVTKQENVGPYSTVQLHPLSVDDPTAVTKWLTDNGFVIPADVQPLIAQYTKEGSDFLAMKLQPNAGVQAMRPVRVTSQGASLSLPLRMASVGTGVTVGISLWVVGDGRYEPQNFPMFHIEDKDLVWDFGTQQSNYTTLRTQNASTLGGKGWEIESSLTLNQSLVMNVVQSGGVYYGNGGPGGAPIAPAGDDYLPVQADGTTPAKTADEVRDADLAALFAGMAGPNVRVTRMRSDIAHSAMTTDLVLQASSDQSELSNVRSVTKSVNLTCPSYPPCSSSGASGIVGASSGTSGDGSGGWGSSCEAAPTSQRDLFVISVGVVALVASRARRRRK